VLCLIINGDLQVWGQDPWISLLCLLLLAIREPDSTSTCLCALDRVLASALETDMVFLTCHPRAAGLEANILDQGLFVATYK